MLRDLLSTLMVICLGVGCIELGRKGFTTIQWEQEYYRNASENNWGFCVTLDR